MSWDFKLSSLSHDLVIEDGKFLLVNGSDEVCQRVKVALWHYQGEYFLNRPSGVPYDSILGSKNSMVEVSNIFRKIILKVPGVIRIITLNVGRSGRDYTVTTTIQVQRGPGDPQSSIASIDGLIIQGI